MTGEDPAGDDAPWLVVGLGNPGPKYAGNRHNLGAMVVDRLAGDVGGRFSTHRARADVHAFRDWIVAEMSLWQSSREGFRTRKRR